MLYKIKGRPNEKVNSLVTGHLMFIFDGKGVYITEDSALAKRASSGYEVESIDASFDEPVVVAPVEVPRVESIDGAMDGEPAESDIRARAKELGIKSYHNKKLESIIKEIAEIEGE